MVFPQEKAVEKFRKDLETLPDYLEIKWRMKQGEENIDLAQRGFGRSPDRNTFVLEQQFDPKVQSALTKLYEVAGYRLLWISSDTVRIRVMNPLELEASLVQNA